jgi:hypothetical protein
MAVKGGFQQPLHAAQLRQLRFDLPHLALGKCPPPNRWRCCRRETGHERAGFRNAEAGLARNLE